MSGNKKIKLSKGDLLHTLSAKKSNKTKPPKTVLVNNITEYWPTLNEEESAKFIEILERCITEDEENRKFVTLGLESCLRTLKRNEETKFLLIADEISPKWFGKHLLAMALTKNPQLKVIIISNLKDITKKILKKPSIVCCIKENFQSMSEFYENLNIHDSLLKHYYTIRPNRDTSIRTIRRKKNDDEKVTPIVYLKKDSDSNPAFVPNPEKVEKMEFDSTADFISFGNFEDESLPKGSAPAYRPLKVKKIIGNLNRKKLLAK